MANIPLSFGKSASARMTKFENENSNPVIKPAPVMAITRILVILLAL